MESVEWQQDRVVTPARRGLRVVVHDYSGHPGQAQLSRALAARGFEVEHQHCPSYATGKGSLERQPADAPTLSFRACHMRGTFTRYTPLSRVRQELSYGWTTGRIIAQGGPDVAVLSNIPLLAHAVVALRLRSRRIPMVFWHQDVYSVAIGAAATKRHRVLGQAVTKVANAVERAVARRSAAIVPISSTFLDKLSEWGVASRATVIPNWAPIDELPSLPKGNAWSKCHGLDHRPVVLYAGTLGIKHDPSIIADLAQRLQVLRPEAVVVVVSEGRGRDWLENWKQTQGAGNLRLLDYQPYEDLPSLLASADVLLAILEPDASRYSAPSKVLTYLCAGRPVVGVLPADNAVAVLLSDNDAGVVVEPSDRDKIASIVLELLADDDRRRRFGEAARAYAENAFPVDTVAGRFESVLAQVVGAACAGLARTGTAHSPETSPASRPAERI